MLSRDNRKKRRAFTLIELLVVVAIIVLLIAILLPSLGQAKKLANTVKCAANLKGISQTMIIYSSEWDQAILGNAHTSGAFLLDTSTTTHPKYSDSYCPNLSQSWDWSGAVAMECGWGYEQGATTILRGKRFQQLNKMGMFLCPENTIVALPYSGVQGINIPAATMISYNTTSCFQYEYGTPEPSPGPYAHQNYVDTGSYRPKLNLVGNQAGKIFIADGARWSLGTDTPDVELNYLSTGTSPGGSYADWGPWSSYSRSYLRPNGITFAMRHGSRKPGDTLLSYKFNASFFDGHAETLDGLHGSDPGMWAPTGSTISASEFTSEATSTFHVSGTGFAVP